jgi:hypothetical protein
MNDYYVYQLTRPWNSVPCYIGKGRGKRAKCHAVLGVNHYNGHLASIYRKAAGAPVPVTYLATDLTEDEALALEVKLIADIGRADLKRGPLANWTDGGERARITDAGHEKIAAANRARHAAGGCTPRKIKTPDGLISPHRLQQGNDPAAFNRKERPC